MGGGSRCARPFIVLGARAALAVLLEKTRANPHGLAGGAAPLECQAQQIHPEQPVLRPELVVELGVDGFVAAHNTILVGTHLAAPHPRGLRECHSQRRRGLRDHHMRALDGRRALVLLSWIVDHLVRLFRRAVCILAEQRARRCSSLRVASNEDERVARARRWHHGDAYRKKKLCPLVNVVVNTHTHTHT